MTAPPWASVHKQTRVRGGRGKQKHDSSDDPAASSRRAQTANFSHQSFVYVSFFAPLTAPQSALQYEGFFVVGLCVGKECDRDFFQRAGQKHSVIW